MKKAFILFFVFIIIMILVTAEQNNPKTILGKIDIERLGNQSKELSFKVYFLGIFPIGKATLSDNGLVKFEERDLYLLSAQANAQGLISKLYPFSAQINSYLEPKIFLPVIFLQKLKTRDKEIVKEIKYDQTNNIMEIAGQRRSILSRTYEPLSALYRLRGLDFDTVSNFDLNINTNQKNYAFTGDISKKDMQLKNRIVKVYRLKGKIFRRDKNPYHQSKVEFILLGNEPRVPIFIRVFASGALITARLIERAN